MERTPRDTLYNFKLEQVNEKLMAAQDFSNCTAPIEV